MSLVTALRHCSDSEGIYRYSDRGSAVRRHVSGTDSSGVLCGSLPSRTFSDASHREEARRQQRDERETRSCGEKDNRRIVLHSVDSTPLRPSRTPPLVPSEDEFDSARSASEEASDMFNDVYCEICVELIESGKLDVRSKNECPRCAQFRYVNFLIAAQRGLVVLDSGYGSDLHRRYFAVINRCSCALQFYNMVVVGDGNRLRGDNLLVIGNNNAVFGKNCRVRGADNKVYGPNCTNYDSGRIGVAAGPGSCRISTKSPRRVAQRTKSVNSDLSKKNSLRESLSNSARRAVDHKETQENDADERIVIYDSKLMRVSYTLAEAMCEDDNGGMTRSDDSCSTSASASPDCSPVGRPQSTTPECSPIGRMARRAARHGDTK